jgi:hypothetical protein
MTASNRSILLLLWGFLLPPLDAEQTVTHPFCGVTHIARTETLPVPNLIHVIQIDLRACGLRFKLSGPGGTREALAQSTLQFLKQEHAQIAINTHFFLPFSTGDLNANLVGLAVSEGRLYSPFEPQPIADGFTDQSYAILNYAPGLNIDRSNHASIVHRDPAFPNNHHTVEAVELWTAFAGSAQIVSNGVKTIPHYTGAPSGLNPIAYSDSKSWYEHYRHARSDIGLTADNQTLILFTVDEVSGSSGMTVSEVADMLMNDYAAYNAINLDGDGSTTLAMEDPGTHVARVVNQCSSGVTGRPVGSNLAIFAEATPPGNGELRVKWQSRDSLAFFWAADKPAWTLQQTASLEAPAWASLPDQPTAATPDCMQVILPLSDRRRFYRLAR